MYPERYLQYLHYFHADRDYFECHEVLEEEWKNVPKNERKPHWVTLIQVAVALYHERRGNHKGALILYKRLLVRIAKDHHELELFGIDAKQLHADITQRIPQVGKVRFQDYNLPLQDDQLLSICRARAGSRWLAGSPDDEQLVHKHRLRKRP